MKTRILLPFIIFTAIVILLWRGLALHPNQVPSPLINKPAPTFNLPTLDNLGQTTNEKDFIGHVTLVNVWATWCFACAEEHNFLLQLAKNPGIQLYGLNYKDNNASAKKWLLEHGNPYKIIAVDNNGNAGIDWGVYGTPETFIVDAHGIIRYKQIGPITPDAWEKVMLPIVEKLRGEK